MVISSKMLIGMVHVQALPGTPSYAGSVKKIINQAIQEAQMYLENGFSGIMIENMHDVPYLNKKAGHEISAMMAVIGYQIKQQTDLPCGIQILAGANQQALAVALASDFDFIRAEGFVFGHLADEGYMDAQAGELLRYRKQIEANGIKIFTDIKKKHSSHALTSDIDIAEMAKAAEFFMADGVIVTGSSTGIAAQLDEVKRVKEACSVPVWIGSGITPENIAQYFPFADAFIVGSYCKDKGDWRNKLSLERIVCMQKTFAGLVKSNRTA